MPIYEYTCQKCKAHVEVMQKVSDKPLTRHRECGGKLEKEWSQTSFQLKGSGWYVTDYAGKKSDTKSESKENSETKVTKSETGGADAANASGDETKKKKSPASGTASTTSKESK